MQEYRTSTIGLDGQFLRFEPLLGRDDGEAVVKAQRMVDGHDIELWNGARLVIRLASKKSETTAKGQ